MYEATEMYEATVSMKDSTRNHKAARRGKSYKFFALSQFDSGIHVKAILPNEHEVSRFLQEDCHCPMAHKIDDGTLEELIEMQASNGLTMLDQYDCPVWIVKSDSIEMVGRKIAKLLMVL